MFFPNRPSFDWVNEKYQILGHHVVGDINKIRGKLNAMGNEVDVMRNELGVRRNENHVLRERVENLERTLNLNQTNLLRRLPCTEEVENCQRKTSQLNKALAPPRSHRMVLRSHDRKASKNT
jgi:hypothetical protein